MNHRREATAILGLLMSPRPAASADCYDAAPSAFSRCPLVAWDCAINSRAADAFCSALAAAGYVTCSICNTAPAAGCHRLTSSANLFTLPFFRDGPYRPDPKRAASLSTLPDFTDPRTVNGLIGSATGLSRIPGRNVRVDLMIGHTIAARRPCWILA